MEDREWLAGRFEALRPRLQSVAYSILGSVSDAEDAVQECWLRLDRSDASRVADLQGWLTTVVGRICLDMLRRRRNRRESQFGEWLPEPIVESEHSHPEHEVLVADSIGLALLVVLETLTPAERLAFVLHDVFRLTTVEEAACRRDSAFRPAPVDPAFNGSCRRYAQAVGSRAYGASAEPYQQWPCF